MLHNSHRRLRKLTVFLAYSSALFYGTKWLWQAFGEPWPVVVVLGGVSLILLLLVGSLSYVAEYLAANADNANEARGETKTAR